MSTEWQRTVQKVVKQNPGKGLRDLLPIAKRMYKAQKGGKQQQQNGGKQQQQNGGKQQQQNGGQQQQQNGGAAGDIYKCTKDGEEGEHVYKEGETGSLTPSAVDEPTGELLAGEPPVETVGGKSRRRRRKSNKAKRGGRKSRRNRRQNK